MTQQMAETTRKRLRDESDDLTMSGADDHQADGAYYKSARSPKLSDVTSASNSSSSESLSPHSVSLFKHSPPKFYSPMASVISSSTSGLKIVNSPATSSTMETNSVQVNQEKSALSQLLSLLREEGGNQRALQLRYDLVMKAKADLKTAYLPPWHEGMLPIVRIVNGDPVFSLIDADLTGIKPITAINCQQLPLHFFLSPPFKRTSELLRAVQLSLPDVDDELLKLSFLLYDNLQLNYC